MTAQKTAITGVFPQANEAEWRRLVDRALKGGSFDALVSKTYDAINLVPLYARAQAVGPKACRRTPGRWSILSRFDHAMPEVANQLALENLEGGADGLHVVFAGAQGSYGGGLTDDSGETIAIAFDKVRFDFSIPIIIEQSPLTPGATESILRFIDRHHVEPSLTRVSFGYDPIGLQALHGFLVQPWASESKCFAERVKQVAAKGFKIGAAVADARVIHSAGGTESQELAFALATALAYLRALADNGVSIDEARSLIAFRLAVDADEFLSVAKFRAIRRLWARVEEVCGLEPKPALVSAETAWRMMSRLDPWNNILRGTLGTFSAAIGGADTITVLPFTQALGAPDAFAHRLARDTQLVLQDESHLEAVDDPTSGAGSFEALTEELCSRAWDDFQNIEAQGGVSKSLENGTLQGRLAETAGRRAKNIARAREKLIGVNEFPDIHEKELHVLSSYDTRWRSLTAPQDALQSPALAPRRLSEPFEALRDASDALVKKIGARPKVFLANLGPVAVFTARANFSKNFFEAGGIEAIFGPETEKNDDIIDAFHKSGAKLACLCSSDRLYGERGERLAKELKQAGAKLYLAGRPGELEQQMRQYGIERFIYVGCDMYEILRDAFDEAK